MYKILFTARFRKSTDQPSAPSIVVEYVPATDEARVRFPGSACFAYSGTLPPFDILGLRLELIVTRMVQWMQGQGTRKMRTYYHYCR